MGGPRHGLGHVQTRRGPPRAEPTSCGPVPPPVSRCAGVPSRHIYWPACQVVRRRQAGRCSSTRFGRRRLAAPGLRPLPHLPTTTQRWQSQTPLPRARRRWLQRYAGGRTGTARRWGGVGWVAGGERGGRRSARRTRPVTQVGETRLTSCRKKRNKKTPKGPSAATVTLPRGWQQLAARLLWTRTILNSRYENECSAAATSHRNRPCK